MGACWDPAWAESVGEGVAPIVGQLAARSGSLEGWPAARWAGPGRFDFRRKQGSQCKESVQYARHGKGTDFMEMPHFQPMQFAANATNAIVLYQKNQSSQYFVFQIIFKTMYLWYSSIVLVYSKK